MTPTRSQVLEAVSAAIGEAVPIHARLTKSQQRQAAQAALLALEGVVGPLSFEDQGSARDHAPSTEKASVASDLIEPKLRCIREAAKNGEPILAKFRDDIYPTLHPAREDLERWNGRWAVIHHNGLAPDGFDIGWMMSAPVGSGGFPDEWIEGWTPLPTPNPQSSGAEG